LQILYTRKKERKGDIFLWSKPPATKCCYR